MRLLDVHSFTLRTFYGEATPRYAILSHTWLSDDEEVTFAQLTSDPQWRVILGARKIEYLCQQAAEDGFKWAWIDTCCIDKSNSAELSEAIKSMFRWYKRSAACYVYMADVSSRSKSTGVRSKTRSLGKSRWWTRAWTLQELLAPRIVIFYDSDWQELGTKSTISKQIAGCCGVDEETLLKPDTISIRSVAQKMSWAARRQATREEDLAYALLGIFGINMTMQYGEVGKAFIRLQKEITRNTDDMSIFAWSFDPRPFEDVCTGQDFQPQSRSDLSKIDHASSALGLAHEGLYATHPSCFEDTQSVMQISQQVNNPKIEERHGSQILSSLMVLDPKWTYKSSTFTSGRWALVILPCMLPTEPHSLVGILLRRLHDKSERTVRFAFAEDVFSCLVRSDHLDKAQSRTLEVDNLARRLFLDNLLNSGQLRHTITVKYDNIEAFAVTMCTPSTWERDPSDPSRHAYASTMKAHPSLCM